MKLELRYLRAFTAVVEHRSIGRAAQALGVAQPVLSRIIQALEHDLNAPLFERMQFGVRLTHQGERLLPHAQFLVSEAAEAIDEIAALRELRRGSLRVGAVSSALHRALPRAMRAVLARYPGLSAIVTDGAADSLMTALVNREIDIMVVAGIEPSDDVVAVGELDDGDRLGVVASADNPLARRERVEVQELARHGWILSPLGVPVRQSLEAMFHRAGLGQPRGVIEAMSASSIKLLIAHTPYLGWLADEHYAAEMRAGVLARINVPGFEQYRKFQVFRRRSGLLPFAARALAEELRIIVPEAPASVPVPVPATRRTRRPQVRSPVQ